MSKFTKALIANSRSPTAAASYSHTMGRIFWQFVATLLLVGFVGAFFWWIVSASAVVGRGVAGRAWIPGSAG
jgi:hypothetical protein